MRLLRQGIMASSFQVPSGALTFRSFSVGGTEGNIGANTGNGFIRTISSPLDNWIFSFWVKNLQNFNNRSLFAGTTGQEQLFEAAADTLGLRSSNVATDTDNISGYTGDTWVHVFCKFDLTNTTRTLIIDNGTTNSQNSAAAFDADYELDNASSVHHWLQDDGEDADCDAIFFDIIGVNLDTSIASFGPTDFNYSTANGGEWTEFSDWGSWGGESYGLGGTDASNLNNDYSGNGNNFTQSTGGSNPVVDRTSDGFGGVPPGA